MAANCASKMPEALEPKRPETLTLGIGKPGRYGAARFAGSGTFTIPRKSAALRSEAS
jgi:hypothetical protein